MTIDLRSCVLMSEYVVGGDVFSQESQSVALQFNAAP
jgi:hypothetical protein